MNKFENLKSQIIPVRVVEKTFEVSIQQLYPEKGSIIKVLGAKIKNKTINSIQRRRLPLVSAYSITAHKSQGQTLLKIIIDLNMPSGMIEVASSYFPLSHVQRLANVAILRDFNISASR
ncbi:unnamed protein product, partial [Rotaria sp. Silwood2]